MEEVDPLHRLGGHGSLIGSEQPFARHAFQQIGHQLVEALLRPGSSRETAIGLVGQPVEHAGHVLERLALQQPCQQQVALLPQGQLVVEIDVVTTRQQSASLQLDQRRSDEQELGRNVEIDDLQALDLSQVGVDDPAQGDFVDIDLFSEDQMQQQVEWPLEDGGCHRKCHTGSG